MDDCREGFGLPYGNLIGPLIAGTILILVGLSAFIGGTFGIIFGLS